MQEAKRVDSRPEHLRQKTRQHTEALQQILTTAEEDKRDIAAAQAREREERKKRPTYEFGLPDDVLLLVLPYLDARSLTRAARVRSFVRVHPQRVTESDTFIHQRYALIGECCRIKTLVRFFFFFLQIAA